MEGIANIVSSKGGMISTGELSGRAEYKRILRATGRGELVRVRQGVYAETSAVLDNMIDIERIVPNGVVCLYNAWSYYRLSTTVPPAFCIAIDAKRKVTSSGILPISFYYWKKEYLEFGIIEQTISNHTIRITDLERSVCDAIKYRNKIGMDVCIEVVRNYLRRKDRNLSRLSIYAKKLRVSKILNNYIEISLE